MTTDPLIARVPGTGADALVGHDGTGAVRTSSGRFLRLQNPAPGLVRALTGAPEEDAGGAGEGEDGGDTGGAAYAHRLAAEMASREADDAERRWPAERRNVALIGHGAPVDALADALDGWGLSATRFPDAADLPADQGWDLVIGYADSPRERAGWDTLDTLPERGTAWLRAYREGTVCFVDPIAVSTDDPTAEQVRRRRLAASPVPGELDAWQRGAAASPRAPEPLSPAASTLLTGRMLTVALAWAQRSDTLEGYRSMLFMFVAATGALSEHPVLAYDAPSAIAGAAAHPS
ncbi:hypothetical protein O4J56_14770 [Nocardiopsis sp. RSe5-2]|uniref:Uncharacterized protein n=1 Tax=Nocardiopsis endophytica TaxID=3018445 RepID=A0ABT4U4L9_9ACTN|nr:hypothetical protein [Nocardiopsis endophytica]MDA2811904.1 hypothetical protein [Nocardiopsis endophytica]